MGKIKSEQDLLKALENVDKIIELSKKQVELYKTMKSSLKAEYYDARIYKISGGVSFHVVENGTNKRLKVATKLAEAKKWCKTRNISFFVMP